MDETFKWKIRAYCRKCGKQTETKINVKALEIGRECAIRCKNCNTKVGSMG